MNTTVFDSGSSALRLILVAITLCLLPSGCGQVPVEAQDRVDHRFAPGRNAKAIPFEEIDGHIFLQVRINNSEPLWFGLDTGAIRSVIDRRVAASLQLKSAGTQQVAGAGGSEEGSILKNVSFKLPGVELNDHTVWALTLDGMSSANGRAIAGILGYELFSRFVVDIDYANRVINLYEPTSYEYKGAGEIVPLLLQDDGEIYVKARVAAPGREPMEGEFVIDTGSNQTLMLVKPFVEKHRLLEVVGPTLPARGGGVGGEIQLAVGRTTSLQVGKFVVQSPLTGFMKSGEIADSDKDGNIGGRFLRRFHVIFDYSRKRMVLEPNKFFAERDESDMSGAALMADEPDFKLVRVVRVRPNSPAAEAGILAGDIVTAINGQAVTNVNKLRHMFRHDGREHRLTLKRGEKLLELKLKLRRAI